VPPRLGDFEVLLLQVLSQMDPGPDGAVIRESAEASAGRLIAPGAIYTALDRLERRGMVTSRLGDPTAKRGGKRRRLYQLEPAGHAALSDARASLMSLVEALAASPVRKP
jgi:PadR family transcriptional regulator PadR